MSGPTRRTVLIPVIAGAVVLAGVGGGVVWQQQRGQSEQDRAALAPRPTASPARWSARTRDQPGTSYSGMSAAQVARSFSSVTGGLGAGPVAVTVASVNRSGDTGRAVLDVRWSLPGGATWAYSEPVPLKRTANRWGVVAAGSRSLWHPALGAKDLALPPPGRGGQRGDLLDRDGTAADAHRQGLPGADRPGRATPATVMATGEGRRRARRVAGRQAGGRHQGRQQGTHRGDHLPRSPTSSSARPLDGLKGVIYPAPRAAARHGPAPSASHCSARTAR